MDFLEKQGEKHRFLRKSRKKTWFFNDFGNFGAATQRCTTNAESGDVQKHIEDRNENIKTFFCTSLRSRNVRKTY